MLIAFLVWVYSLLLFYAYGSATGRLFTKVFDLDGTKVLSFPITVVLGLTVVTTITSYISLLFPVAGAAAVILLAGALTALIWNPTALRRRVERQSIIAVILIFLGCMTALVLSTYSPSNPDTALYHAQSIRWIESYRVVPGLANIHYRLAENSSWMLLNAAFSFRFLGIQSLHLAGSALTLIALLYFGQGFQGLYERRITISNIAKCILFISCLYVYGGEVSSAGTDLPASLFIWIVAMLLVEKVEANELQLDALSIAIFALSIFAVTIKLSAAPLLAVVALLMLQEIVKHQYARAAALGAVSIVLVLPWIVRSVILSGYLIFPLNQLDVFTFDWKYPRVSLDIVRTDILWFARFPVQKWASFVGLPLQRWLPLWFENLPFAQRFLFLAAIGSPLGLLLIAAAQHGQNLKPWLLPFILNFLGILFWLLTAPNLRFGYGFLVGSLSLLAAPALLLLLKSLSEPLALWVIATCFLVSILVQGALLYRASDPVVLLQRAVMPADYLPSRARPCPIRNAVLYCRRIANQCNYDLFPCIANPQRNVEMRGPTFRDGFRTVPPG